MGRGKLKGHSVARSTHSGSERVYALHDDWLGRALLDGDSLLTPMLPVWTDAHLAELTHHFVDHPDEGSGSFLTKLNGQLRGASSGAVQLMAELHLIYFLIITPSAISAARKLSTMETILSWMPQPPQIPEHVREALGVGLVHPGQWVMTRRDLQLSWLIYFASTFRALPDAAAIAQDPWSLRSFTEKIRDDHAEGARLALLHLSHPDTFEATVSSRHRGQIHQRFAAFTSHDEDTDRALIDIRAALAPVYGEDFNFYVDPLIHQWPRGPQWRKFMRWTSRFRDLPDFAREERDYKVAVAAEVAAARSAVTAGADDGLELLRKALQQKRNNLTAWRTHEPFLAWLQREPSSGAIALQELWGETSPSDVEGWPRLLSARIDRFLHRLPDTLIPTFGARLNLVAFLLMAHGADAHPPLTARLLKRGWDLNHWRAAPAGSSVGWNYVRWLIFLDEVVHDSLADGLPLADRLDVQSAVWRMVRTEQQPSGWSDGEWQQFLEFRGEPVVDHEGDDMARDGARSRVGTPADDEAGEGEDDSAVAVDPFRDRLQEAAEALLLPRSTVDELVELLDDKGQLIFYGPPGTGKTYVAMHLAEAIAGDAKGTALVQFHPSTSYEDFMEGLRPQITPGGQVTYTLTDGPLIAMARMAARDPDRTFVLVIDEINRANLPKVFGELLFLLEYRNRAARLMYRPDEEFRLPENLRIIGTMNTADRSVALIDAAMRRRFNFAPFFPDQGPMQGILHRWLTERSARADIAPFLDAINADLRDRLGPHFAIGPSHFMRTNLTDAALGRIWDANVFPLLEEFFWGDEQVEQWRWPAVQRRYRSVLHPNAGELTVGDEVDGRDRSDDDHGQT